ncbi:hypothetical protein T11_10694 [Trichinella zimbabwensis]|uniref:Uncharacterized protein n=1 Tax=Trichinella zimbabwensis TaxID=268475 RepID=A0A0V1GYD1_9BILA|nr:hypothetical protein T11_10694 [Trichinella zimbabwensis]
MSTAGKLAEEAASEEFISCATRPPAIVDCRFCSKAGVRLVDGIWRYHCWRELDAFEGNARRLTFDQPDLEGRHMLGVISLAYFSFYAFDRVDLVASTFRCP